MTTDAAEAAYLRLAAFHPPGDVADDLRHELSVGQLVELKRQWPKLYPVIRPVGVG